MPFARQIGPPIVGFENREGNKLGQTVPFREHQGIGEVIAGFLSALFPGTVSI
jgi:hypothetical protein